MNKGLRVCFLLLISSATTTLFAEDQIELMKAANGFLERIAKALEDSNKAALDMLSMPAEGTMAPAASGAEPVGMGR